jgi:RNA polymerase sigma-70 factor (ECF subfamily)
MGAGAITAGARRDGAASPAPPGSSSGASAPAGELLLMQRARAAMAAGNYGEARKLLEQHRLDFPAGRYAVERSSYLRLLRADLDQRGAR